MPLGPRPLRLLSLPHRLPHSLDQAQAKKKLIKEGKLDKHGRKNADTPAEWLNSVPDYRENALKTPAEAAAEASGKVR